MLYSYKLFITNICKGIKSKYVPYGAIWRQKYESILDKLGRVATDSTTIEGEAMTACTGVS
ncbi:mitochondrial ribosomal protein L34 isoform X2 [Ptiloglossa arizonensis]|uniref:mitochondrial ribosomal protein L34 isoform X2 n=1 Tax=Ptiloglossa arizonensis TaxID=3350558 RepID=UPI003F9FEE55